MGIFSNTSVYLIGQIESDPNAGDWRADLTRFLYGLDQTITVWDPLVKPNWMPIPSRDPKIPFDTLVYQRDRTYRKFWSETEQETAHKMWEANTVIRSVCKSLVGNCVWAIARLKKAFTWGSIDELEIAINRKIPLFMWFPDGPIGTYGLPGLACAPGLVPEYIFFEKEQLEEQIKRVHTGAHDLPSIDPQRWIFRTYPNAVKTHVSAT